MIQNRGGGNIPSAERKRFIALPAAIFAVCAALYVALGSAVSHSPPRGLDAAARAVAGEAPRLAWIFTASCLWPTLTTLGVVGAVVAWRVPNWRARILFAIVTTIASWQLSNVLKDVFARPRPDYWIVYHETTYAYSSGHAMFAVLVYGWWATLIARSAGPIALRIGVSTVLSLWGIGVIWSRLALGAHYPSDLAGGILLAVGMLAAAGSVARLIAPRARLW